MLKPAPAMLVLICGDHRMYVDLGGRCILAGLPFPVILLVSRESEAALRPVLAGVAMLRAPWSDFAQIEAQACTLAVAQPVFAVATMNESLMALAACLRAALGVRGMPPPLTERFRHKLRMKEALRARGVAVPEFAPCSARQAVYGLLEKHGKLVIKPVDGLGSRMVSFIDDAAALDRWYDEAGPDAGFEAEQFIGGTMYHVNALVRAGQVLLSACALYVPGKSSIDYRAGQPLASVLLPASPLRAGLSAFSARVIAALGMDTGVTHLECFHTADGAWVVCEIAARPAGGGIVPLIESHFGVNFVRAALLLEGGVFDAPAGPQQEPRDTHGLLGIRANANATVVAMPGPEHFDEPWIRHRAFYVQSGQFIRAARQSSDFLGLLILRASDLADFDAKSELAYRRFMDHLRLENEHVSAAARLAVRRA